MGLTSQCLGKGSVFCAGDQIRFLIFMSATICFGPKRECCNFRKSEGGGEMCHFIRLQTVPQHSEIKICQCHDPRVEWCWDSRSVELTLISFNLVKDVNFSCEFIIQ